MPDASTSQKGLARLNSDSTATDNTTAATPGMVRNDIVNRFKTETQTVTTSSSGETAITLPNNGNAVIFYIYSGSYKYAVARKSSPIGIRVFDVTSSSPVAVDTVTLNVVVGYLATVL